MWVVSELEGNNSLFLSSYILTRPPLCFLVRGEGTRGGGVQREKGSLIVWSTTKSQARLERLFSQICNFSICKHKEEGESCWKSLLGFGFMLDFCITLIVKCNDGILMYKWEPTVQVCICWYRVINGTEQCSCLTLSWGPWDLWCSYSCTNLHRRMLSHGEYYLNMGF